MWICSVESAITGAGLSAGFLLFMLVLSIRSPVFRTVLLQLSAVIIWNIVFVLSDIFYQTQFWHLLKILLMIFPALFTGILLQLLFYFAAPHTGQKSSMVYWKIFGFYLPFVIVLTIILLNQNMNFKFDYFPGSGGLVNRIFYEPLWLFSAFIPAVFFTVGGGRQLLKMKRDSKIQLRERYILLFASLSWVMILSVSVVTDLLFPVFQFLRRSSPARLWAIIVSGLNGIAVIRLTVFYMSSSTGFSDALTILGAGRVVLDRGGRIIRCNREISLWSGQNTEELKRKDFTELFLERDNVREYLQRVQKIKYADPLRALLLTGSGTLMPLDLHISSTYNPTGILKGYMVILKDLSLEENLREELNQKKKIEYELKKARRTAEEQLFRNGRELQHASKQLEKEIQRHLITESALRESETLYQTLVQTSPTGVTLTDLDGRIVLVNRQAVILSKATDEQQLIGHSIAEFIVPDKWHKAQQAVQRLLREKLIYNVEQELYCLDGTRYSARVHGSVITKSDGSALWMMFVHEDISELIKTRRQLELFNRCLLRFTGDHHHNIRLLIELLTELSTAPYAGYYRFTGEQYWLVTANIPVKEQDIVCSRSGKLQELLREGIPFSVLSGCDQFCNLPSRYETVLFTAWQLYPISENVKFCGILLIANPANKQIDPLDPEFIQLLLTAVGMEEQRLLRKDSQRRLEMQLIQAQRFESLGTMAGGMAHEINNPLTGIINYAEIVKQRACKEQFEQIDKYAGEIVCEGKRIAGIVRSLMSFARQDKDEQGPINLNTVVQQTIDLADNILVRDQIVIKGSFDKQLPAVWGNEAKLRQVILNMIFNSADAVREQREITIDQQDLTRITDKGADIHIKTDHRDNLVQLVISDRGSGIPDHIKDKIYEPFFTTKQQNSGTGLGLAAGYGIIREHGGTIELLESRDCNTVFMLSFPTIENIRA